MRCRACNAELLADWLFCTECGAHVEVVCPACEASNPPTAKFCRQCGAAITPTDSPAQPAVAPTPQHLADKILMSRSALEGERKQVTVLFADVRGSMDLQEALDPEEWRSIMDGFFRVLSDGVHRFEGTVDKFTGDGIMALFGAPIAHEDHAQRACYAALQLREDVQRYAAELHGRRGVDFAVRLGLNSGEVVVGGIGDDLRMTYTAVGHTVGLAQRMEAAAEPGTACLSEHTARLVEGFFELEDLGARQVKGVLEPLHLFELRAVGPYRTHFDVSQHRGLSKFVGRTGEMQILRTALDRVRARAGQVVGVMGLAGTGKSRLCYEFAAECRAQGMRVHEGHGLAHGTENPYLPMLEFIGNFLDIVEQDSPEQIRTKVRNGLRWNDTEADDVLLLAYDFLGVPDPEQPGLKMGPEARHRHLCALVQRVAQEAREPGTIWLEDLHWFDHASLAMLGSLIEAVPGSNTLVLASFRPEFAADWMHQSSYQQLALAPLDADATSELLVDLLGQAPSLNGVPQLLRDRTGGNPFFIEEAVQDLAEHGALAGTKGAYTLTRRIDQLAIPATVQAVLDARIDRLPEEQKTLLQTAAVIGRTFSEPVLRQVMAAEGPDLDAALHTLVAAEFVYVAAHAEYTFKHALTQEVAYHSQLTERRQHTHAAVAQAIEALSPDDLDERAAEIARHYDRAGDPLTAAFWHRRAAQWNGPRDYGAAFHHWRRVRELLASVADTDGTRAFNMEACMYMLSTGWRVGLPADESTALFEEGKTLAVGAGHARALALLHTAYGVALCQSSGDMRVYVDLSAEGARLGEEAGDAETRAVALTGLAAALMLRGSLRAGIAAAEDGIELTEANPDLGAELAGLWPFVFFINVRALMLTYLGRIQDGMRELERVIKLATELGDMEVLGWAHGYMVLVAHCAGEPARGLAHVRELGAIAQKIGSVADLVLADGYLGDALVHVGEYEGARAVLEKALSQSKAKTAGIIWQPDFLGSLAEAYLGCGDGARARATAEEAAAMACDRGAGLYECKARLALARVLLGTEGAAARTRITAVLDRACELIDETGARVYEPFIRMERAELARLTGDGPARERELREAHRLFTDMGAPIRAEQVEALLAGRS